MSLEKPYTQETEIEQQEPKIDIDGIPEFEANYFIEQLTAEREKEEDIQKLVHKIFKEQLTKKDFQNIFALEPYNLDITTIVSPARDKLIVTTILSEESSARKKFAGYIELHFYPGETESPELHIEYREITSKAQGIGLDIQCQIDDFCRSHNINTIHNEAVTNPDRGMVGAYVWARYGYDFEYDTPPPHLLERIEAFAQKLRVTIHADPNSLKRPIDFAKLEGTNEQGEPFPLGKEFLTKNECTWMGKKDLSPNSQSTQDFIMYLHERGREDLLKKYYPEESTPASLTSN